MTTCFPALVPRVSSASRAGPEVNSATGIPLEFRKSATAWRQFDERSIDFEV
jgi:hypothetical protein